MRISEFPQASLQFSNLPGPTHTLVVGGFPLKGIYPIYPPSGKIRVGISAFSYADQVHLTVVSHRSLPNAGPSLLQGITAQVDQLSKQLSQRRVPGESRRSARHSSLNNPEMTKPPTRQIHMQLQVVQEELQQLSHRLDTPKMGVVLSAGSDAGEENLHSSDDESLGGGVSMSSRSPADQAQLRTRLKTLKTEFSELIGELRRRSSIVEGVPMSFEDEECEDDYRKPRKRALSVVSMSMSRRNSIFSGRSLTTPESSGCYSSSDDDDHPSSPSHEVRMFNPNAANNMRLSSSPIRTTAV
ncbi:putative diacylglycerol O-acyltransferase tgs1 [Folsomia candida]|uniref:Putative diacylglycerol O-acyltransferase tgs1 n=1 Tax=Folsomia candida TaxID=158441 RepID=A0A226ENV8_FOLCA|nr:putative diacylglycerol O-acyltransferase tgs1 [Folsomia candida]